FPAMLRLRPHTILCRNAHRLSRSPACLSFRRFAMSFRSRRRSARRLRLEPLEVRLALSAIFGISGDALFHFDSAIPQDISTPIPITALQPGDHLAAIEFASDSGQLYGVGIISGGTDTLRTYTINTVTGAASLFAGIAPLTVIHGNAYDIASV